MAIHHGCCQPTMTGDDDDDDDDDMGMGQN